MLRSILNPITIPSNISLKITGSSVEILSGSNSIALSFPISCSINIVEDNKFKIAFDKKKNPKDGALCGLVLAKFKNALSDLSSGYSQEMHLHGVGYKMDTKGKILLMSIGLSHDVAVEIPEDLNVTLLEPTKIKISGYNRESVSSYTAFLKSLKEVEPYKLKGMSIVGQPRVVQKVRKKK